MELHTSFGRLSEVVERYERRGRPVRCTDAVSNESGGLRATLEIPVSLCPAAGSDSQPALSPEQATLTDGGGFSVEFSAEMTPPLPPDVSVADQSARIVDGGDVRLTVTVVIDSEAVTEPSAPTTEAEQTATETGPPTTAEASATDAKPTTDASATETELTAIRDESVPAYEDQPYLERLYETCDTFAEMSRKIAMDVAGETVRRYMIDAGVHTPDSYETAGDGSTVTDAMPSATGTNSASRDRASGDQRERVSTEMTAGDTTDDFADEQFVTDGLGLPEGVQITDIAEAVASSSTVYDVQRRLDLEGEETWKLLQQLGLLDLLVGRISEERERNISYEAVTSRIRQSTANSA